MVHFYSCPEESRHPLPAEGGQCSQGFPERPDTLRTPAPKPSPRQATASGVEPSKEPWGQVSASGAQRVRPVHLGSCNPAWHQVGFRLQKVTSVSRIEAEGLPGSPVVKSHLVMQGTRVGPLVGELNSHMLWSN